MSKKSQADDAPNYQAIESRLIASFKKTNPYLDKQEKQQRLKAIIQSSRHDLAIKETLNFSAQLAKVACSLFGCLSSNGQIHKRTKD